MTKEAYEQVIDAPHKAHLSHELIGAAAAYEAVKSWDEHKKKQGVDVSHGKAKEFIAAAAAAFITHIGETKGLDALDHYKAKQHAEDIYKNNY